MLRKLSILLAASALALGVGAGLGHSTHALAAPGGGASLVAQYCQANPGGAFPGSTVGGCVSYITSGQQSSAWAPGLCNFIATSFLGNGYGFVLAFYDYSTAQDYFVGPVYTKGQCVSALVQNTTANSVIDNAFYP